MYINTWIGNLPPLQNIPTDNDLLAVATEITKILQDDWPVLQAPLNVPDQVMLKVLSQPTTCMSQQVFR